jgi:hypothetical protein
MNTDVATLSGYEPFEEPTFIAVEFEERGPLTGEPRATPLGRLPRERMYRAIVATGHMYETHLGTEWTPYASVAEHEGTALESDLRWQADPRSVA